MDLSTTVKLNNGVRIPALGLGTWQLGPRKEAVVAVEAALKAGYRHIDTAARYRNEQDVGKAIRSSGIPRKEIFVTTKLWNDDHDNPMGALEASLGNLKLEYVDLYLIHFPVPKVRLQTWKMMEEILASGKVKAIGVSNFTTRHLDELLEHAKVVPAVNQVEFHPFLCQKELLEYCKKKGIQLEAYSPLTHGHKLGDPRIVSVAKKHNKSSAQVLIRWGLQHGLVVIPKSKTAERIQENAHVFDFELSPADMNALNACNENLRFCWDPTNEP